MQELQEMQVQSLDWEDPLEEGMATHSSTLPWRIPWAEEPGGLQPVDLRVRHDSGTEHARTHAQEAGSLRMESVPLKEEISETHCLSLPREDGARKKPTARQEKTLTRNLTVLAPWSWTASLQNYEN